MSEPVEHVLRGRLPWRREDERRLTECGRAAESCTALTSADMDAKIRAQGQQRAGLSSCMTCWDKTGRKYAGLLGKYDKDDPVEVLRREIDRSRWGEEEKKPLQDELRALGMLVAAHREEYDTLLRDIRDSVDIGMAKLSLQKRASKGKRPPPTGWGKLE